VDWGFGMCCWRGTPRSLALLGMTMLLEVARLAELRSADSRGRLSPHSSKRHRRRERCRRPGAPSFALSAKGGHSMLSTPWRLRWQQRYTRLVLAASFPPLRRAQGRLLQKAQGGGTRSMNGPNISPARERARDAVLDRDLGHSHRGSSAAKAGPLWQPAAARL